MASKLPSKANAGADKLEDEGHKPELEPSVSALLSLSLCASLILRVISLMAMHVDVTYRCCFLLVIRRNL